MLNKKNETMEIMENNHIVAAEGKVFRRKSDGVIFGNEIYLGYTWYINDTPLDEPRLETAEDFEEVDFID